MKEKIKIGYIGLGRRGYMVLEDCIVEMPDVEIAYLCDLYDNRIEKAAKLVVEKGRPDPIKTTNYKDILNDAAVDAVFIMTDWASHAPLAKEFVLAGKYTGVEVGCAYSLKDCFDLVEAYEKTGAPLMMLENACYCQREMMALNMVKQGLFGEIVHCDGGYQHYLPESELFAFLDDPIRHYRIGDYRTRNCEQYPTHELGPISKVLGINRGNRFIKLNSIASASKALKVYAKDHLPEWDEFNTDYAQGDIITTIITCANGETIRLTLDTTLPRAYYSRNFTVRGTKGMCNEERRVVFLEGMEEGIENNEEEFFKKYNHPLYNEYTRIKEENQCNVGKGHGGVDWLVCRAFIESVKAGINTPIDAYDTAAWMSIAVLSAESIEKDGAAVEIPDFTNGKWKNREPVIKSKYCLDEICEDDSIKIM